MASNLQSLPQLEPVPSPDFLACIMGRALGERAPFTSSHRHRGCCPLLVLLFLMSCSPTFLSESTSRVRNLAAPSLLPRPFLSSCSPPAAAPLGGATLQLVGQHFLAGDLHVRRLHLTLTVWSHAPVAHRPCYSHSLRSLSPTPLAPLPLAHPPPHSLCSVSPIPLVPLPPLAHPTLYQVTVGGQPCTSAAVVPGSTTRATCVVASGSGKELAVIISVGGRASVPRRLFSYFSPVVSAVSRAWGVAGTTFVVSGVDFGVSIASVRCRAGGQAGGRGSPALSTIPLPSPQIMCALAVGTPAGVNEIQVSNDGGDSWGDSSSLHMEPWWRGGGQQPGDGMERPPRTLRIALIAHAATFTRARYEELFAVQIAQLNRDLPFGLGVHLVGSVHRVTGADQAIAVLEGMDARERGSLIGIVGGAYSSVAIPLANYTSRMQIPFIGTDASSSVLSSPQRFPFFVRVGFQNQAIVRSVIPLLATMRWHEIAVFASEGPYERDLVEAMPNAIAAGTGGVRKIGISGWFEPNRANPAASKAAAFAAAKKVADSGIKIIYVVAAYELDLNDMFEAIGHYKLNGTGYALILAWVSHQSMQPVGSLIVTGNKVMTTSLDSSASGGGGGGGGGGIGETGEFCSSTLCADTPLEAMMIDTVAALVKAASSTAFPHTAGAATMQKLRSEQLDDAASGPVRFEDKSNDRNHSAVVFNVINAQPGGSGKVIATVKNDAMRVAVQGSAISWPGGGARIPGDPFPFRLAILLTTSKTKEDLNVAHAAVRAINKRTDLLPFTQLVLNTTVMRKGSSGTYDGKYDPAGPEAAVAEMIKQGRRPDAIVSRSSGMTLEMMISPSKGRIAVPFITYNSNAPKLANKTAFPSLVRMGVSAETSTVIVAKLMRSLGWHRLFIIAERGAYSKSTAEAFVNRVNSSTLHIEVAYVDNFEDPYPTATSTVPSSYRNALERAHAGKFSVLLPVLDTTTWRLSRLIAEAANIPRNFTWLAIESGNKQYLAHEELAQLADVSNATRAAILDGALRVSSDTFRVVRSAVSGQAFKSLVDYFHNYDAAANEPPLPSVLPFTEMAYAVLFAASAFDACIANNDCDNDDPAQLLKELRSQEIEGVTGLLAIDTDTNDRARAQFSVTSMRTTLDTVEERTVATLFSSDAPKMRTCGSSTFDSRVGPACSMDVEEATITSVGLGSVSSIRLEWDPAPAHAGLLKHYRVAAEGCRPPQQVLRLQGETRASGVGTSSNSSSSSSSSGGGSGGGVFAVAEMSEPACFAMKDRVFSANTTSAEFSATGDGGDGDVRRDHLYKFTLQSVYDAGVDLYSPPASSSSIPANASNGLPCIPVPRTRNTCGCRDDEFHSAGLPGDHPTTWRCRTCPVGVACLGRTWADIVSTRGYYVAGRQVDGGMWGSVSGLWLPAVYPCRADAGCQGGQRLGEAVKGNRSKQCAPGFDGIVCDACGENHAWPSCKRCAMGRDSSQSITVGIVVAVFAFAWFIYLAVKRLSRPPLIERRFIDAFEEAEKQRGLGGSIFLFRTTFPHAAARRSPSSRVGVGGDGGGIGREEFAEALGVGGKLAWITAGLSEEKRRSGVEQLWGHL